MPEEHASPASAVAGHAGSGPRQALLRALLGSLGFANLCALNLWHRVQALQDRSLDYYRAAPPGHSLFAATVLVVLAVAVFFFLISSLARRIRQPLLRRAFGALFLSAFLIPAYLLHDVLLNLDLSPRMLTLAKLLLFPLYFAVLYGVVSYLVTGNQKFVQAGARLNLVFSPLVFVSIASYAIWAVKDAPTAVDFSVPRFPREQSVPRQFSTRILWLIFDEFDYDIGFARRPQDLTLPELDRLRHESFFAGDAYPPAGATLMAMPSLINGRSCGWAEADGPSTLRLKSGDGGWGTWVSSETVFARMCERGAQVGVVGWFHPYCRMFPDVLSSCVFVPATWSALLAREAQARELGPWRSAWYLLRSQLALLPLVPKGIVPDIPTVARVQQLREFREVHRQALEQAGKPDLGLVLVHYPVPHPYGIYDRRTGTFSTAAGYTYVDNLVLADRIIGELRREVERAGLWDRTTWIVSSDHALRSWWDRSLIGMEPVPQGSKREGEGRVPFIIRLPGEQQGREYPHTVNTVITARLIMAIAGGKVRSSDDLENWLRSAGSEPAAR